MLGVIVLFCFIFKEAFEIARSFKMVFLDNQKNIPLFVCLSV